MSKPNIFNSKKKIIIAVVLAVVGVLLVSGVVFAADYVSVTGGQDDSKIANGIYIGDVDVSGKTKEEALEAVEGYIFELGKKEITLTEDNSDGKVEFNINDLGLVCSNSEDAVDKAFSYGKTGGFMDKYKNLKKLKKGTKVYDMEMNVSEEKVQSIVADNSEQFETPAEDASLEKKDGQFVVTPDTTGVKVDIEKTVKELNGLLSEGWAEKESLEMALVVEVDVPRVTAEDLESVKDVLGTFNTNFSSSGAGRVKNLQTGAEKINGTVLLPGEEFSMYEAVNPFTAENGYAKAGAYQDGEVIESMGGGICQVSTTLFNAVLRAELEITERMEHSMTVSYVPWGTDAAIAGTYKDLKFKNNQEKPVYIEGYTSGRDIYFTIYGEETRDTENRVVTYENKITSRNSSNTKYVAGGGAFGSMSKKSGHDGGSAELYKVVTENGVEVSREKIYTSSYRTTDTTIEVGTAGADAESVAALQAAISSQDINQINAAIAAGKHKMENPEPEQPEEPETPTEPEEPQDAAPPEETIIPGE